MYTYLHNPRCSKSRTGLKNMKEGKRKYELRAYLINPLDYDDLVDLQKKLNIPVIEFTRTWEKEFAQAGLTKESSDDEILKAMAKFPKLMERPIVYDERWAAIGRPEENIINFIKRK